MIHPSHLGPESDPRVFSVSKMADTCSLDFTGRPWGRGWLGRHVAREEKDASTTFIPKFVKVSSLFEAIIPVILVKQTNANIIYSGNIQNKLQTDASIRKNVPFVYI